MNKHPIEVLKASKPKLQLVTISSGDVFVRSLNAGTFDAMQARAKAGDKNAFSNSALVAATVCDENGKPAFESVDAGLPFIVDMDLSDVVVLAKAASRLSGLSSEEDEQAEEKKS